MDYDADELLDLILNRYSNFGFIESMDVSDACDLFIKAILKRKEENLYQMYLVQFEKMDKENYISFEQYQEKVFNPKMEKQDDTTVEQRFENMKKKIKSQ